MMLFGYGLNLGGTNTLEKAVPTCLMHFVAGNTLEKTFFLAGRPTNQDMVQPINP